MRGLSHAVETEASPWQRIFSAADKYYPVAVILICSLYVALPLSKSGFFESHEYLHNLVRLAEVDDAVHHGQLYARWFPNLNGGYGYPFLNYYSPLAFYIGEIFRLIRFSIPTCVKLAFALAIVSAGLGMYLFARLYFPTAGALIAAIAYLLAPYHIVDIYVRGNIAEFTAMGILPFVFWALARLDRRPRIHNVFLFAIVYGLLIMAHNITAMAASVVLVAFAIFLILRRRSPRVTMAICCGVILGLALSAFYWLPALIEMKYVKITVLTQDYLNYSNHFVYPWQLIVPSWGYGLSEKGPVDGMSFQLGLAHWAFIAIALLVCLIRRFRQQAEQIGTTIFFLASLVVLIVLMLPVSKLIWDYVPLIAYIQFPWRLLALAALLSSFLGGHVSTLVASHRHTLERPICAAILILLFLLYAPYCRPHAYRPLLLEYCGFNTLASQEDGPDHFINTTGDDYMPRAVDELPPTLSHKALLAPEGVVEATPLYLNSAEYVYRLTVRTASLIRCQTFWFPGWHVYLNGKRTPSQPSSPHGLIEFFAPAGLYDCRIVFQHTVVRSIATWISVFTFLAIAVTSILSICRQRRA
jgi:hypothetical protein